MRCAVVLCQIMLACPTAWYFRVSSACLLPWSIMQCCACVGAAFLLPLVLLLCSSPCWCPACCTLKVFSCFLGVLLMPAGGGFTAPYDEPSARLFYQTAGVINGALAACFPEGCGVRIIAEPGR